MGKRAVFIDRDGVLNELVFNPATGENESPLRAEQICILPGAVDAALQLKQSGFELFIVSNQPNAAKGKASIETLKSLAAQIEGPFAAGGAKITQAYYCFHHPDGVEPELSGTCECRKPGTGSLIHARDNFGIDLAASWMIGDQESDVECGRRAGCRTVLITNPLSAKRRPGKEIPTLTASDLRDAVKRLLDYEKANKR